MSMEKRSIFSNLLWRLLERIGAQAVTFIVSIVLMRLLEPAVYGTIALVTVFITILQVFVDSGMGNALIQKLHTDDLDFSTVFYFNISISVILYGAMFLAAPVIARFYAEPELTPVVRVLGLTVIISGVKNIQQAYVSRNMLFKRFFFATLGGTIGAAIIGIWMAKQGYGIWALVAQNLFNQTVDTVILWITVKWRPKRMFSWQRLMVLFSYGWKLLLSALIETGYKNLRTLIIGKLYNTEDLALYDRGMHVPAFAVENIDASISSVLFPAMSQAQEDREQIKKMTRRTITVSTYLMAPMMIGLIACAEPLIRLVFTEKWMPCIPFLRIFCITYIFYPIHTANLNAIKAVGRSDLFLKLEIIKKIIGISLLLATMWYGPLVMAYSTLVSSVLSQIINSWPNRKLLNYSYLEQLKDIMPGILLAVAMGLCVYLVQFLRLPDLLTLCIQVPLGAVIYIGASKLLHLESYEFAMGIVKGYVGKESEKR